MSDETYVGAEWLARAERILGRPAESEEELADALHRAQAEDDDLRRSDLAVRVRALELHAMDPSLPSSVVRLMAEAEAELDPVVERPDPDDVHRAAAAIARTRGTTIEAVTDVDELAALYTDAERALLATRGRS